MIWSFQSWLCKVWMMSFKGNKEVIYQLKPTGPINKNFMKWVRLLMLTLLYRYLLERWTRTLEVWVNSSKWAYHAYRTITHGYYQALVKFERNVERIGFKTKRRLIHGDAGKYIKRRCDTSVGMKRVCVKQQQ